MSVRGSLDDRFVICATDPFPNRVCDLSFIRHEITHCIGKEFPFRETDQRFVFHQYTTRRERLRIKKSTVIEFTDSKYTRADKLFAIFTPTDRFLSDVGFDDVLVCRRRDDTAVIPLHRRTSFSLHDGPSRRENRQKETRH